MQKQEVIIRNPLALNEDALGEEALPEAPITRVTVVVGQSPKLGLQLIMNLLVHRQLQCALQGLNLRFDKEVMESLANIVMEFQPRKAHQIQMFSYPSAFMEGAD